MTPKRIREVERLARTWAEIANDDEAAPMGTMRRVVLELLIHVKAQRKLLRRIRPWLDMVAVTDDAPEPKLLLKIVNAMLRGRDHAKVS